MKKKIVGKNKMHAIALLIVSIIFIILFAVAVNAIHHCEDSKSDKDSCELEKAKKQNIMVVSVIGLIIALLMFLYYGYHVMFTSSQKERLGAAVGRFREARGI